MNLGKGKDQLTKSWVKPVQGSQNKVATGGPLDSFVFNCRQERAQSRKDEMLFLLEHIGLFLCSLVMFS